MKLDAKSLKELENIAKEAVKSRLAGLTETKNVNKPTSPHKKLPKVEKLNESLNVIPRSFSLKTEKLSNSAKEAHELLYKNYTEAFNKTSSALDAANTQDAKSTASAFRSLKDDETFNFNGLKLHELYFTNIGDVASQISVDSLPYIRLSRDFGSFERWQFDFIACALSARNGWAMTVFEPYRNVFMNVVLDGHTKNVPLGAIPIIVMDMWEHAYFKDYLSDKKSYVVNMMKELNWNVIEARMLVVDSCNLHELYKIQPLGNPMPSAIQSAAKSETMAPIQQVQAPEGSPGPLAPNNPPAPAMTPNVLTGNK